MNDTLYKDLIVGWIPFKERPILKRSDLWLVGIQKIDKSFMYNLLMADISIHTGMACDRRYCICKYFPCLDRINAFNNGLRNLPLIF